MPLRTSGRWHLGRWHHPTPSAHPTPTHPPTRRRLLFPHRRRGHGHGQLRRGRLHHLRHHRARLRQPRRRVQRHQQLLVRPTERRKGRQGQEKAEDGEGLAPVACQCSSLASVPPTAACTLAGCPAQSASPRPLPLPAALWPLPASASQPAWCAPPRLCTATRAPRGSSDGWSSPTGESWGRHGAAPVARWNQAQGSRKDWPCNEARQALEMPSAGCTVRTCEQDPWLMPAAAAGTSPLPPLLALVAPHRLKAAGQGARQQACPQLLPLPHLQVLRGSPHLPQLLPKSRARAPALSPARCPARGLAATPVAPPGAAPALSQAPALPLASQRQRHSLCRYILSDVGQAGRELVPRWPSLRLELRWLRRCAGLAGAEARPRAAEACVRVRRGLLAVGR